MNIKKLMIKTAKELITPYINDINLRSVDNMNNCMYNGKDNRTCAFGRAVKIKYRSELEEGNSAYGIIRDQIVTRDMFYKKYQPLYDYKKFWNHIQRVHDLSPNTFEIKQRLKSLIEDIESDRYVQPNV